MSRRHVANPLPGQELVDAYAGKLHGATVTVLGSDNAVTFDAAVQDFEQKTGIDIRYESSSDFETTIVDRANHGNQPDIADFPQPGLLGTLARQGKMLDVNTLVSPAWLQHNYLPSWLDMATVPGASGPMMTGVWSRVSAKSLVWYPKQAFDAAGYEVPQTWAELMTLTNQIAGSGATTWCIGMESAGAAGWVMTDWIEDTILRTASPQDYDSWVVGALKFDSPQVRSAISYVTDIWFNDAYVYGGRQAIAATHFGDVPLFDTPPKCWLHRQANFITFFFPEDKVYGQDYDFFYLPSIDSQYGRPVLIAGNLYGAHFRPVVERAVMQYFSTGDSAKGWMQMGGAISPHRDASPDWYQDPILRKAAAIIHDATTVRFDASDLMPGEIGSGSFWREMTAYVNGTVDLHAALTAIDNSWPQ